MNMKEQRLLFLILLLATGLSQAVTPLSTCLGNCSNCDTNDLSYCIGQNSCEEGLMPSDVDGMCIVIDGFSILKQELVERKVEQGAQKLENWSSDSQLTECHYKQQMLLGVQGLFQKNTELSKKYVIEGKPYQIYILSFNLVRSKNFQSDEFLVIDIQNKNQKLDLFEIELTSKDNEANLPLKCNEESFLIEKYSLKIFNQERISDQINVIFKGFVKEGLWGISNVKLIGGNYQNHATIQEKPISEYYIKKENQKISVIISEAGGFQGNQSVFVANITQTEETPQAIEVSEDKPTDLTYLIALKNDKPVIHLVIHEIYNKEHPSRSLIEPSQEMQVQVNIEGIPKQYIQLSEAQISNNCMNLYIRVEKSIKNAKMEVFGKPILRSTLRRDLQETINYKLGELTIQRYDSYTAGEIKNIEIFEIIFSIFAWIAIFSIIISVLLAKSVVFLEYIQIMQIVFLHVYIAPNQMPLSFTQIVGGLNIMEKLTYFIPSNKNLLEQVLMGNVVQESPMRFTAYREDINFSRSFYPIILINIFFAFWFIAMMLLKKFCLRKDYSQERSRPLYRKILDNIVTKPVNYIDQIVRYQFITTIWLCFVQFYNLSYPDRADRNQIMNALICILSFVSVLVWFSFMSYYTRKLFYEHQYSEFIYKIQDMYHGKISRESLPNEHQRIYYPIAYLVKITLVCLIIAYAGEYAIVTLLLLIGLNAIDLLYTQWSELYVDQNLKMLKNIENVLLIAAEIFLVITVVVRFESGTKAYYWLGFVASLLFMFLIINGILRVKVIFTQKVNKLVTVDYASEEYAKNFVKE